MDAFTGRTPANWYTLLIDRKIALPWNYGRTTKHGPLTAAKRVEDEIDIVEQVTYTSVDEARRVAEEAAGERIPYEKLDSTE